MNGLSTKGLNVALCDLGLDWGVNNTRGIYSASDRRPILAHPGAGQRSILTELKTSNAKGILPL